MADFDYITMDAATPSSSGPQPPKDLSHLYSRVTKQRVQSKVKDFYKYFAIPGIGNLAGGLPNASYFPYETLEAQVARADRFTPSSDDSSEGEIKKASITKKPSASSASAHITVPHASSITDPLRKIDLTTALQYGTAQGYPALYSFLRQFARENLHPNVPYLGGPDIILTNGSTDGLAKCLECLSNVWSEEKDWIREREGLLCEEFAYMNAVQGAAPRGLQAVPVKIDLDGMLTTGPGGLEDVLANWDESKGKRPHLMYTVTMGQNPTSSLLSVQRRKDIYALCSKYDVIIIEDDPYWYLQFPSAASHEAAARGLSAARVPEPHVMEKTTGFDYLDSLVPSFLNFDPDGRVLRLDTFSKTVAPGCRLGWITGQPAIIERLLRITETSTQQPSGFVQSMIAGLVMGPQPHVKALPKNKAEAMSFNGWQVSGWVRWLEGLRGEYERRMTRMCTALEAGRFQLKQQTPTKQADNDWAVISKTEMYEFDWPRAGMFVWVHMFFNTHPLFNELGQDGPLLARNLWIFLTTSPYKCLVTPGGAFSPTPAIAAEKGWQYFRLCFAAVDDDTVTMFSERFAQGVSAFWKIKDRKEFEAIDPPEDLDVNNLEGDMADLGFAWAC
ncbi:PLP-dependent transferase-3 [Coleophoma crateriformis]|uniref:PLP-dependent transferase-3 n=1 Tax=Coleophoma crateriformis TaxID=565419 RepID=A0A3D8SA60_9HELO|nr:PLP-dependent transferase-3 [Coleophoma crateriformis]